MRKPHVLALAAVLFVWTAAGVVANPSGKAGLDTPKFDFALIGDLQYGPEGEARFPAVKADIDAAKLAFVVHDGDFKSGSTPCDDATFRDRHRTFDDFAHPFVFVPGDNDWTDCHRPNNGGYDPLERLAALRALFYPSTYSLGRRTIELTRQSDVADDAAWTIFKENQRWTYGNVVFVALNVQGSNNNLGRAPQQDAEYAVRNAAVNAFMRESFALAKGLDSPAIMLIVQANPSFETARTTPTSGFRDFLTVLEAETLAFAPRPVVLVHGDSHYFRIDKPLTAAATGRRIENFTRVETFGERDNHWVRGSADPRDPNVFSFAQQIVEANVVNRAP